MKYFNIHNGRATIRFAHRSYRYLRLQVVQVSVIFQPSCSLHVPYVPKVRKTAAADPILAYSYSSRMLGVV